jgi:Flp pilus assembly protein TadG
MVATTGKKRKTAERGCFAPLRRLMADRSGVTAIEFAILAMPFLLLIFATIEICVAFAAQQVLANTTDTVAREIRTGQLQPANLNQAKLQNLICTQIQIIVANGCPGLHFDLEQYSTFAAAAAVRTQYSNGDLNTSGFGVNPGGSGTKNMLRVYYEWPLMTGFMSNWMSNVGDGKMLLFATDTWQNEPY